MRILIFIVSLFSSILLADGVELNLPDKFNIEVIDEWTTENGKRISDKNTLNIDKIKLTTFYFNNNNFTFNGHSRYYSTMYENELNKNVPIQGDIYVKGQGNFTNGQILGKAQLKVEGDINRGKYIGKLNGNIEGDKLHIFGTYNETIYYQIKVLHVKKASWGSKRGQWENQPSLNNATFQFHYLLQLPIKQSQQKFIDEPQQQIEEPTQEQPQSIIIPKTNLSANNEFQEEIQKKEINPCQDPDFKNDPEWQKYCVNNAKLKVQNKILDEREDKKIEEELKADEEHQAKLAKYNEEERQINLKVIRENEKKRKEIAIADKQRDKAFRDKIAKEQEERKAFNEQEQKNLALVSRSAKDTDTWKQEYHRIKRSKERYGSNLEKAKKLNVELQAHAIVNHLGDTEADKWFANKKISELSENSDIEQVKKVKGAIRKQFYDSKQIRLQGEAEFMTTVADEFDKSAKKSAFIRDTAVNVETAIVLTTVPVLNAAKAWRVAEAAELIPGTVESASLIGEAKTLAKTVKSVEFIATRLGVSVNAIDAFSKEGVTGSIVSLAKDYADNFTFKLGGEGVDMGHRLTQYYYGSGAKIPSKMKVYDEKGFLKTRFKKGDRIYIKDGEKMIDTTFYMEKKLWTYNCWTTKADKDLREGDANKKAKSIMNIIDVVK